MRCNKQNTVSEQCTIHAEMNDGAYYSDQYIVFLQIGLKIYTNTVHVMYHCLGSNCCSKLSLASVSK